MVLSSVECLGQPDSTFRVADHYKTSTFDVAIFPESYVDLISGKRFTPTRQDVDKAEVILLADLKKINKHLINQSSTPIIHKNLLNYKRQYFGYVDKNGDRILLISSFWSSDNNYFDWLKTRVYVLDGGSYYWSIKLNLNKNKLFDLAVNGES